MINDYELVLKGYSLDELKKEKNESTPTTQEETDAEPWLIDALEKASEETKTSNFGKVRSEAKAYTSIAKIAGAREMGYSSLSWAGLWEGSLKLIHVVVTVNLYTTWIVKMAVTLNL